MSPPKGRPRVVVDGSNIATEGRSVPSLDQLDEAVAAFAEEFKASDIIVVVDASFEHRVTPAERAKVREAEESGRIVAPPAGAIGRGDAFLLTIAQRVNAMVLSNDSFQEFHSEHPWLFDAGRLIGGKPVRGVGWIFTPRQPVRSTKSRAVSKAPVVKSAPPKAAAPKVEATKSEPVKATKTPASRKKKAPSKTTKVTPTAKKKAVAKKAPVAPTPPPTEALRRARKPVNSEESYTLFRTSFRLGARLEGTVKTFTSHGAVIRVSLKDGSSFECYAPTALLATPPPARARDVLARGDVRNFKLVSVDPDRRIAELALP